MNTIIALKGLVELLSKAAGISERQAEEFVRAFAATVTEGLKAGEMVRVKGVGVFGIDPGNHKITFVPDTELAEDANAPFNFFKEVELNPGVTEEMLTAVDSYKEVADSESEATKVETEEEAEVQEPEVEPEIQETEPQEPEKVEEPMPFVEEIESEPASQIIEEEIEPEIIEFEPKTVEPEPEPIEPEPESNASVLEPEELELENVEPEKTEPAIYVDKPQSVYVQEALAEEPEPKLEEEPESETNDYNSNGGRPGVWWLIWAAVIGVLVGFAIGYFVHDPIQECFEPALSPEYDDWEAYELDEPTEAANTIESVEEIPAEEIATTVETTPEIARVEETKTPAQNETTLKASEPTNQLSSEPVNATAAVASQSAQPVYDEIRSNYFLTHMSNKHYGTKDYWVYIYLENQDKIQNPNRINIGTKLLIPPIEKYATQATQEERIAAARKKAGEIQAKFK